MQNDLRTVTGRNIHHILSEIDQADIFKGNKRDMKKKVKFASPQPEDEWKIALVKEITNIKQNTLHLEENENGRFSIEELSEIVNYVTTV